VCEVHGSDAAISLLALGRIGADNPSLRTNDPDAAVALSYCLRGL
jgi:hypothetical protein